MPATLYNFTLYRGVTFAGLRLMAVDATGSAVALNGGTTALLQARKAAGKALAFELPVNLGEAVGEILIPEVSATTTAALSRGEFEYDLILISADEKPWPPILRGVIKVEDIISQPSS
jgi:hypothetical protein